ncbi:MULTISPECIES: copper homeostasis protein CutC [unclassified Dyadobacter]|uniref:copper homeostasis protein CutC n=1 Tax=unclassified Dyadobacter TaxID=2625061 RepID=UPI001F2EB448|nr:MULTISPECIES: copper homeostasis protein CutC [unclassified Dyadobacter]MCE7068826.1 copper homeostasis protein CutC [Dyadobacter sp. CY327]MCF2520133.1 copper homeostasis protein CutC [Dyadobacter sp. CY351]
MTIEVCAYSLESCINAQAGGAGRIELCGGLGEGGTTPSAGLIELVRQHIDIDIFVMIRPRGGDFVYDIFEEEIMRKDIDLAKKLGANGVVLGILTSDGQVDVTRTKSLVEHAKPMKVTFHRAFDLTPDPVKALKAVIETGAERILTSGQKPTAVEGIALLEQLSKEAGDSIEIMAGAGVNHDNAAQLAAAGVHSLHLTAKAFRPGRQKYFPADISMAGGIPDEHSVMYADLALVEAIVQVVS